MALFARLLGYGEVGLCVKRKLEENPYCEPEYQEVNRLEMENIEACAMADPPSLAVLGIKIELYDTQQGLSNTLGPYNTSVTLVKLEEESNLQSSSDQESPRRPKRVKLEDTVQDIEEYANVCTPKRSKVKRSSPKKLKPIPQSLATPHPAPEKWRDAYDAIKDMRSNIVAPVDSMGSDSAQLGEKEPQNQRMKFTDAAVKQLRAALGGSISVQGIIDAEDSCISEAIAKVGFWRRKTQYVKQTAIKLRDEFDSDVPKTVDELCSLPGVGPKMAFLALQIAWNLNHGIGVDVHVHRITNRLGWHKPPTKNPEETRLNLQSWLPTELHPEINHLLVGFGQMVCLPVRPKCGECTLSLAGTCPSAQLEKPKAEKSKKAAKPVIEVSLEGA
ncbi:DNA glycosylase [Desarmillaria tabescens]|uniref:Endonuclease III homolog n=1 Tax=Armillaria tabescens TaxID=1929756 RepID=A0AA39KCR6_ARMTA|nr:DNA glycosylase [Desarmillaria tabescens]KAK0458592.1 DNA glycosylase [Desarmillaria tabescens]